jgi:protein-S-isoprenylcysteine O-methyltransferase Ste14
VKNRYPDRGAPYSGDNLGPQLIDEAQGNRHMDTNSRFETRPAIRPIIGFTLFLVLVPALLFVSAGTVSWPMAWVYVVMFLAFTIGSRLIVWKRNPDTLRERARFTASEGTKSWDRTLFAVNGLFGAMAIILAGLDHRFDWSTMIPQTGQYLAALLIAVGYGLGVWAMAVNRYFSAVARIQQDRGQVVVATGPYRIVRHPAYAGALLASLAVPIMLDAIWSLIPTLVMVVALALRTSLEDRMLREELDGYETYAEKVRYRLVPGLW